MSSAMCPAEEQPVPEAPDPQPPSGAPGRLASEGASETAEWAYVCDPGTARDNNEDYAGTSTPERAEPLFVVADGMGGHAAGEVASRLAVETVLATWEQEGSGSAAAHQRLRSAVRAANVAVFDASHDAGRRGMGSTLTALVLAGKEAIIAHAGDSRAYLIRDGQASQLTADHSRVGEMLRMRLITAEQAARHPARSMLTRSLGTDPMLQIDLVREPTELGDCFVLCSDGLWDSVARGEIAEVVSGAGTEGGEAPSCPTAAAQLVELALKRDAPDNVTVAVIRLVAHATASGGRRLFRRFSSRGG